MTLEEKQEILEDGWVVVEKEKEFPWRTRAGKPWRSGIGRPWMRRRINLYNTLRKEVIPLRTNGGRPWLIYYV